MRACAWSDTDTPFDANLLGLPNMMAQPDRQDASVFGFDVEAAMAALEKGLGGQDVAKSLAAMRAAITEIPPDAMTPDGAAACHDGRVLWLGPRSQPLAPFKTPGAQIAQAVAGLSAAPCTGEVAMGVVDTSIAFANQRFRRIEGQGTGQRHRTRFKMLWLQDRYLKPGAACAGAHMSALGLGTLLLQDDIDALFDAHTREGILDETGVYAEFQPVRAFGRDLWSLSAGHGTMVLDLMAGAVPGTQDAERAIYGVELPTAVVADTSGALFHGPLVFGLAAIAYLSHLVQPKTPLVMNASMAFVGGPHSGKRGGRHDHPTADALARLANLAQSACARDVRLTLPSGNHLQDRLFAEGDQVTWLVPPNDRTASSLEIWRDTFGPHDGAPGMRISVKAPGCAEVTLADVPAPGTYRALVADGREIARLYRVAVPGVVSDHLELVAYPTHGYGGGALAPPGRWRVRTGGRRALFWSLRDDTLSGLPEAGQQARLSSAGYNRFDASGDWDKTSDLTRDGVRRDGTLSVLATNQNAARGVLVTVYGTEMSRAAGPEAYRFSGLDLDSAQHLAGQLGLEPEGAFAPRAEVSRALGGPLAARRMGRGTVRWAGTSMASAIAARQLADSFAGTAGATRPEGYREP